MVGEDGNDTKRVLFGYQVSALTKKQIVDEVVKETPRNGVQTLITMNVDHVVRLQDDARFRRAYRNAWIVTLDGMPVFLYSLIVSLGVPELVTGSDLLADLAVALPVNRMLFFVVSKPEVGERLREYFTSRGFPSDSVKYVSPDFGFENDPVKTDQLIKAIRDHGATDLFFGIGAPKTEIWLDENRARLGNVFAFGFGSGLDFLVGVSHRAPVFMRRVALEWLWRLLSDPGRLWRRYLVHSWAIIPVIVADARGRLRRG